MIGVLEKISLSLLDPVKTLGLNVNALAGMWQYDPMYNDAGRSLLATKGFAPPLLALAIDRGSAISQIWWP